MLTCFFYLALTAAANGANDVSRAAATLVGGRVAIYKRALLWTVTWTLMGSLLSGWLAIGLARRFANAVAMDGDHVFIAVPAILLGSFVWIGFSTYLRLPVATTHALVGGLLGVTWFAGGWAACHRIDLGKGFVVPLVASPLLAIAWSGLLRRLIPRGFENRATALNRAHWISAGLTALSRGVNDSAKIWAILIPIGVGAGSSSFVFAHLTQVTVALAMLAGSLIAGNRVTGNLAFRLSPMSCADSVVANVTTASIIIMASILSFPVASSHVVSGAILGVGLVSHRHALQWKTMLGIATAWLLTLPGAAIVSIAIYFGISQARNGMQMPVGVAAVVLIALLAGMTYSRRGAGRLAVPSLGERLVVFVCNSNTSRSPMAAQLCSSLLDKMHVTLANDSFGRVTVVSRGISARQGEVMGPLAAAALLQQDVVPKPHHASSLSQDLVAKADIIFCMTEAQVKQVVETFPSCLAKVWRLHPDMDIPNPAGLGQEAFENVAALTVKGIRQRMGLILAV